MRRAALLVTLLAACGGGDDAPATDAADPIDAPAVDAAIDGAELTECTRPDPCEWIDPELRRVVSVLSGAEEASPGVTFTRRSTAAQRQAVREWLVAELARIGVTAELVPYSTGVNVRVHLAPTTGPDEGPPLIVGAHFDGVAASPAAADNATGTAVAVVAARYLTHRPRARPVDIVIFDQEEAGLIGSGAYVAALGPTADVYAMHNFDMISFDGDGDGMVELWSPDARLEALYRSIATAQGLGIEAVTFGSSDHQSFVERGIASVGVSEEFVSGDHTPHYHRATDTLDKVDFGYLGKVTRMGLTVLQSEATN